MTCTEGARHGLQQDPQISAHLPQNALQGAVAGVQAMLVWAHLKCASSETRAPWISTSASAVIGPVPGSGCKRLPEDPGGGGGLYGPLASHMMPHNPPTHPPTPHISLSSGKKMKFIKGAGNLRPILGHNFRDTNFFLASEPPTHPPSHPWGGRGFSLSHGRLDGVGRGCLAKICPALQHPPPLCDIPSSCCSFTGPWTVTRSSLRMLRRVAAFCRPLRPVLLLVSFLRSRSPVDGVWGLC